MLISSALSASAPFSYQSAFIAITYSVQDALNSLSEFRISSSAHVRRAGDLSVRQALLERHIKACPQAVLSCEAAPYGCDFQAKAPAMEDHSKTCPLAKLVPFLKAQNDRLETHAKALDVLRAKHCSLQTVLSCIRETLETFETRQRASEYEDSRPVTHTPEAYDATTHHLLCGQESLQRDVERMSTEISNLDRKATLMVLQESFETKDELARANATISSIRAQVNWLTSANHQRGIPTRPLGATGNAETSVVATDPHRPLGLQASRRPSSDVRQEPKL
ncbi:MAG: hypothetical protein Q9171_004188 [Xanthocarpia ochracea]